MQVSNTASATATNVITIRNDHCNYYKPVKQTTHQVVGGEVSATFSAVQDALNNSNLASDIAAKISQATKGQTIGFSASSDYEKMVHEDCIELVTTLQTHYQGVCTAEFMNSTEVSCSFSDYYDTFDGSYGQFVNFKLDCIFENSQVMKSINAIAAKVDKAVSQTTTYNDLGDIVATVLMVAGVAVLLFFSPEIMASSAVQKAWSDPIGKMLVLALMFGLWGMYLAADCGGRFPWFHIPLLKWGIPPSICSPATKYPLYIGTGALAIGAVYLAVMTPKPIVPA